MGGGIPIIDGKSLRISIHMLISHYNALLGEAQTLTGAILKKSLHILFLLTSQMNLDPPGMVGTIDQTCNILNVAEDAYDAASSLCDGQ